MKNTISIFLVIAIVLLLCLTSVSCNNKNPNEEKKDIRGTFMVGEFIQCSVEPASAETLINNSGMSGLSSYIHLHNTNEKNSYIFDSNDEKQLIFSFSQIESLGYMYIWNYNVADQLTNGIKDIKIQYSTDKENWQDLKKDAFQLSAALKDENTKHGGNAANNQNDKYRTPIDFGGVSAQYVRLLPQSNHGGDSYGLGEVRFFKFKTRPDNGSLISASSRAPKTESNAVNLTNNYGLSNLTSSDALQDNDPNTMWYSEESAKNSFVIINLDGTYPTNKMYIWNYNNPENLNSGMKNIKIEYTTKQPYTIANKSINYTNGEWTELGTYTLPEGTGQPEMPYSLEIDLKNTQVQHVRITPIDNYGGDGFGLSAVRIFAGHGWAVEPSRDWSQLFSAEGSSKYQGGWVAADGIYSLNLNGNDRSGSSDDSTQTLFMFSDTLTGHFNNFYGKQGTYGKTLSNTGMKNNSFASLTGNKPDPRHLQFHVGTSQSILGNGNWAQELLLIDNKIYAWSFPHDAQWSATKYIINSFEKSSSGFPDFKTPPESSDINILFKFKEDSIDYRIEFSNAVMDNTTSGGATPNPDGYIYLYGLKSHNNGVIIIKEPVVARVTPSEFADRNNWRFWNGTDWTAEIKNCAPIDGGDGLVSNEYSVSYMENGTFAGKYIMNFTNFTQSTMLAMATSDTPYGPFNHVTDKIALYNCPETILILEANSDTGIYTYNSKAHPHLSAEGELLISYNVNSMRFDDKLSFEFLHPQFVTLFDIKEGE